MIARSGLGTQDRKFRERAYRLSPVAAEGRPLERKVRKAFTVYLSLIPLAQEG